MRAIVRKYIDRRTESEGNRRLVQKRKTVTVIFVHKAVPTLLVNYLPTKNEENRLSEAFRTFISLGCILTQG